jgi:hypothetical protein
VQVAKHEIENIRKTYDVEVYKVNKVGNSDASPDEIYKPTVPRFSTAD